MLVGGCLLWVFGKSRVGPGTNGLVCPTDGASQRGSTSGARYDDDDDLASRAGETEAMDDRAEYEEFQRWLRFRDRRGGWQDRRPQSTRRRDDDDDDDGGSGFRTNAGPPPAWDGSECPFEDYLIRARIWISTTKAQARTRGPLLLKSLSSTPFQDFKHLAKDPAWLANPDNAEMLLKKMDSPEFYGDDQDEHLLASLARVTYHLKRQKNETARQFLGRWEAAERKVQEHKVLLPSLYRGFLMINALGLSDQEIKTLLTFTHGSIEPKDIKVWLRKHETKLQAGQIGNDLGAKAKGATAIHAIDTEDPDRLAEGEENDEIGAMEAMLADLAEDDPATEDAGVFEEDEAAEILAMSSRPRSRRTRSWAAAIGVEEYIPPTGIGLDRFARGRTNSPLPSSSSVRSASVAGKLAIGTASAHSHLLHPARKRPICWRLRSTRTMMPSSATSWRSSLLDAKTMAAAPSPTTSTGA